MQEEDLITRERDSVYSYNDIGEFVLKRATERTCFPEEICVKKQF